MGTISDCLHCKVNLKKNFFLFNNSTTQRCPNKIIKSFLIEDFFHLPLVSRTPVELLELWISLQIFEKILNGPLLVYLGAWGKPDSWKKPEVKNLVALRHCPFNVWMDTLLAPQKDTPDNYLGHLSNTGTFIQHWQCRARSLRGNSIQTGGQKRLRDFGQTNCSTTGKPTRSFASERVSLDSV